MRLIGIFETENEAYTFYSFLLKEGIQNIYEPFAEEKTGAKQYRVWIYEEDDLEAATTWLHHYKDNPHDTQFQQIDVSKIDTPPTPEYKEISQSEDTKWQKVPPKTPRFRFSIFTLTNLIIALCGFLFLLNDFQEGIIYKEKGEIAAQIAMTPLQYNLLFDVPASYKYIEEMIDQVPLDAYKDVKDLPPEAINDLKKAESAPSWRGLYAFFHTARNQGWESATSVPMFEKIQQGQFWRLFTPCVLHRDFLHILFNMIWAYLLLKQVEERLHKLKLCLLIVIIGIISNVAQYLVGGPYFLGFSGIVVGLAGFIWMRQKKAPWEGYPLQRSTLLFLLVFVIVMFVIELLTLSLKAFSVMQLSANIANTAHIVGGLVGIFLGRLAFFGRKIT